MTDSYGAGLPVRGSHDVYENIEAVNHLWRVQRLKGEVTLDGGESSTTVSNEFITADTVIVLTPRTANAAAEAAYVSDVSRGEFTITHANNAQTDRTFFWQGK